MSKTCEEEVAMDESSFVMRCDLDEGHDLPHIGYGTNKEINYTRHDGEYVFRPEQKYKIEWTE